MFQSPNAMARAAYEDALAQIKNGPYGGEDDRVSHGDNVEVRDRGGDCRDVANNAVEFQLDEKVLGSRIGEIWCSSDGTVETKVSATMEMILTEIDSLMSFGLGAFYDLDATTRQLNQSKELLEMRSREAKRLHFQDEQSRASLSNLLRVVESSKQEVRDSSRSAQVEARLRHQVNSLRDERDKALTQNTDLVRKLSLHEEELRLTKAKLSRVQQEKLSLERDSRVAISLARSLDNSNSNDINYYKRKVSALSDEVQSAYEKIRQLEGKKQRNSY